MMARTTPHTSVSDVDDLAAFSALFASAFAQYTIELLTLARQRGLPIRGAAAVGGGRLPVALRGAPPFVQESYRRAHRGLAGGVRGGVVQSRVAREQFLLAMRKQGRNQTQIAKELKMSPAALSRILKAPERSRVATLRRIANVLGVDLSDIL